MIDSEVCIESSGLCHGYW